MAFDRDFAEHLAETLAREGWMCQLPDDELPNPLFLQITERDDVLQLVIHARRITHQSRSGPSLSDHGRPAGEMHTQMIFDGDVRGAGSRNHLRFISDAQTVLFGFHQTERGYVVAAYDPEIHKEYAYSKSLQVKEIGVGQALQNGMAFQLRKNGETIVIFHLDQILEYLKFAQDFHHLQAGDLDELSDDLPDEATVRRVLTPFKADEMPTLKPEERKVVVSQVGRYVRHHHFAKAIRSIYERCAICGFQYDYILDGAHIVPVVDGGTDTYDNGLGLCPNCHRMYDKGLVLVDEQGKIYLNPRYAEEYDQIGRADSLEMLRTQTLRTSLWLPDDEQYHPSAENLRHTFLKRR